MENQTYEDRVKELITNASANPAELKFPPDKWGFTADIRKAVLRAGASIGENKQKHDLLVSTLLVLLAHTKRRYAKNVKNAPARQEYLDKIQATAALKQKQNYV